MTLTLFQGTDSGATIRLEAEPDGRLELHIKSPHGSAVLAELEQPELLELLDNLTAIAAALGLVDQHRRRRITHAAVMAGAGNDPLQMAEAERIEAEANRRAAEREAVRELLNARGRQRPAGGPPTTDELNEETRRWKEAAEERARLEAEEAARLARLELEPTLPGLEPAGPTLPTLAELLELHEAPEGDPHHKACSVCIRVRAELEEAGA
jgi:hypothetical protein